MEKTGGNLKEHIKNFVQATQMQNKAKEVVEEFLEKYSQIKKVMSSGKMKFLGQVALNDPASGMH